MFDWKLLSKQNCKPAFGALLAFLFTFSTFVSLFPQDGNASTLFEGGGESEDTSGSSSGAPTTALEICGNLLDDDGDGLVDNQDSIDCPEPTDQAPTPTPTPEVEEEEAPEEDEEEVTPTPTPTPEVEEEEAALSTNESLTPAAEICNNTFDDDGDGLVDSEDTEDCPAAAAPEEDEEEVTPTPTPTPTPT
ncbi:MAG: hypothetical protein M3297_15430, partial [Thermoproteota archaeon]|nr:hypothetical protein [Thermoproteota archaeon]